MKEISIKIPEWMDEDLVKLQVERLISLEKRRRELVEEVVKKLELSKEDLKELEKVREEVWKEEKRKLGL